MTGIRIAVLVSGGGTNLEALIKAQKSGMLGGGIIALVVSSSPKAYALERAKINNIESIVVSKKDFGTPDDFDKELLRVLIDHSIDIVVLAGYLSIIGSRVIAKYGKKIINVHPSLIPSFCGRGIYGLRVHEEALNYGVKITGATVHHVTGEIDMGKIILQKAVDVLDGDTPEALQKRVMEEAEWIILPKAVRLLCDKIAKTREGEVRQ